MIWKRTLSLVLALALTLGLSGGASATEAPSSASSEAASSQTAPSSAAGSSETADSSSTGSAQDSGEAGAEDTAGDLGFSATVTYDPVAALSTDPAPDSTARATLLMDAATGTVLWEKNSHEQLEPASVTKVMTMLLVCEAIDAGQLSPDQSVSTSAHAAGMGGSQVYLEEGEQMTVRELLKAVAVASGNDAAVALGEAVAGSESAFVERMNNRAAELGMEHTHFCNCTGLPADGHVTCAEDIARMSRELLKHDLIREFTGIWMDSLRDGAFQLSSTNKLIRSYEGCTGLKTGFTSTAGYCISATALRGGLELIAVVLGAKDSKDRFATASTLLDYGFANFKTVTLTPEEPLPQVPVSLGTEDAVELSPVSVPLLIRSADEASLSTRVLIPETVEAPIQPGDRVGTFLVQVGDQTAAAIPLCASNAVEKLQLWGVFRQFVKIVLSGQG